MIRKIVLAFILMILLAVVSYVKTVREDQKINQRMLAHQIDQKNDSLTNLFVDSIQAPNEINYDRIDSLITKITGDDIILNIINKNGQDQLAQHQKIYQFYTQQYASLDQSLTVNEVDAALKILREKTASKFSISQDDLLQIRKHYNLDY